MSDTSYQGPGQGSAGATDIVTQLQGIVRQFSTANINTLAVIAAIKALFPQKLYGYTVATLPAPSIGMMAYVTDGTSGLSWGDVCTGGHSTPYLVWYNGSAWTVAGK